MMIKILLFAFITYVGGSLAKTFYDETGSWNSAWAKGAKMSLGLAVLGWLLIGTPSCDDSDGIRCYEYADDGYVPTFQQRNERFANILGYTMAAGTLGLAVQARLKEYNDRKRR